MSSPPLPATLNKDPEAPEKLAKTVSLPSPPARETAEKLALILPAVLAPELKVPRMSLP